METFTFILGLILGIFSLSMKRTIIILKLIISSGIAFIFMRLIYPDLYLLDPNKWYPGYFISKFFFVGIIFTILSYFVFQYLPHLFLSKFLEKKYDSYYQKLRMDIPSMQFKRLLVKAKNDISKMTNKLMYYDISENENKDTDENIYKKVRFFSLSIFTICFSGLLCSIFINQLSSVYTISIMIFITIVSFIIAVVYPYNRLISILLK